MINIREFLGLSYYVSSLDDFLNRFRSSRKKLSDSERAEIDKYARISKLRDKPTQEESTSKFWDKF